MANKSKHLPTDLYRMYLRRFISWRTLHLRGVALLAFGKDVVKANMNKYAALTDIMLRVCRVNDRQKRKGDK
jgi:hypothetical protein